MSWPTSLESNVTSMRRSWDESNAEEGDDTSVRMRGFSHTAPIPTLSKRASQEDGESPSVPDSPATPNIADTLDDLGSLVDADGDGTDTSSSNKTSGNTTIPPTMFGIIPLGNSFSIPITYSRKSKFSAGLPESSLSDDPSTWTSKGVTNLNWTVSLTKGTRFILVAGIGSAEQWASGGSSEMMTVGQGGFDCFNKPGAAKPSVTMSGSSTGALNRPTASASGAGKQPIRKTSVVGIVIACVFSALGTLALVTCLWCCCRVRRQRRAATSKGLPKPSIVSLATFGRLDTKRGAYAPGSRDSAAETQLDLISDGGSSRPASTWSRRVAPTSPPSSRPGTEYLGSPVELDTYGYAYDLPFAPTVPFGHPPRSPSQSPTTTRAPTDESHTYPYGYTHVPSPLSPVGPTGTGPVVQRSASADRMSELRHDFLGRQASIDGLVSYPTMATTPANPPSPLATRRRGPLVLHDSTAADGDSEEGEEARGSEDITNLKRDTLAFLDTPRRGEASGSSRPRRRRTDDDGAILVHRDAGRLTAPRRGAPVLELPPRYEELDWDDDDLPPPRRASSVPVPSPSPSPRPASFAGSASASAYASPSSVHLSPRGSPRTSPYPANPRPLSHGSDGDSAASSPIASLPPGAAPPRAPRSPMDSPASRRSPLDRASPVPSRHSMA